MVVDGAVGPLFFERIGGPQQLLSTGYPPRLLDDDHSSGVSQVTAFFFFFFFFLLLLLSPVGYFSSNLSSRFSSPQSPIPFFFATITISIPFFLSSRPQIKWVELCLSSSSKAYLGVSFSFCFLWCLSL